MDQQAIIDWPQCIVLAAGHEQLAQEILSQFTTTLPAQLTAIEQAYAANNIVQYTSLIHRLHGACCYCALPNLKRALVDLENHLRGAAENDKTEAKQHLQSLHQQFRQAATAFLNHTQTIK